jgi:hypothetical protein
MSETWGTVVVRFLPEFGGFEPDDISENHTTFVEKMFEAGGSNKKALASNGYVIENATRLDNYLLLETFGSEWEVFANSAMKEDRSLELYARFADDYGSHSFFARNDRGQSFSYGFEEDSDEFDQDDFDPDEYQERICRSKNKWLSITPKEVIESCPSVVPCEPEDMD